MPLNTKHLYYQKNNETYAINLYDALGDVGNNAFVINNAGTPLFAALGEPSSPNASALRLQKDSVTWAILFGAVEGLPLTSYFANEFYDIMDVVDEGMYPVTVSVNNISWGTAVPGTVAVAHNGILSATATPFSGRTFSSWTIYTPNGTSTSTNNPLSLTITLPTQIVATFA